MKLYRNFTSQEEIDLEYNIALNVADRERWIEWYARESAKVRDELDCMLDVRFGPTVDETIDIFPARKPSPPMLVTFGKDETQEFHRQSTDFLQAWRANGLRGEMLVQEGKHHLSVIEGLAHGNSSLCDAVIDFMMRCEKGQDKGS